MERNQDGSTERCRTSFLLWGTECIAIQGAILSERNSETARVTTTHQANEEIPTTSKWVGKAEMRIHHKPHPWHRTKQLGQNAQLPVSLCIAKSLGHTSSIPTSKAPTEGWGPQTPRLGLVGPS